MGMLDGVTTHPSAKVGVVGLYRNEETLEPVSYFDKFVNDIGQRIALVIDPMLATGGSAIATLDMLKQQGCKDVRVLVLVAAKALKPYWPSIPMYEFLLHHSMTSSMSRAISSGGWAMQDKFLVPVNRAKQRDC